MHVTEYFEVSQRFEHGYKLCNLLYTDAHQHRCLQSTGLVLRLCSNLGSEFGPLVNQQVIRAL